jgi:Mrp family chromosome partitioning ATPase
MDRIRKALDRARAERIHAHELDVASAVVPARPPEPVRASVEAIEASVEPVGAIIEPFVRSSEFAAPLAPQSIVYTRTRVFTPDPDVLERNRIINPTSTEPAASAFRMLRTQVLQRMDANGWRSLAIFSPGREDGKTTTAINLAVSLAAGRLHTVLLVDFDFQQPMIANRLGLAPEHGADDVLLGAAELEDCLYHPEAYDRLVILPARASLANSSEILAGPSGRTLASEIRARYPERIIVYDLPPVLSADDALSFAPLVECGLVVAAEGQTRRNDLVRTIELLAKTSLLGTVLNRASDAPKGY